VLILLLRNSPRKGKFKNIFTKRMDFVKEADFKISLTAKTGKRGTRRDSRFELGEKGKTMGS
jgi:hypothetical protein